MGNLKDEVMRALQERFGLSINEALATFEGVWVEFEGLAWEEIPDAFATLLVDRLEDAPRAEKK